MDQKQIIVEPLVENNRSPHQHHHDGHHHHHHHHDRPQSPVDKKLNFKRGQFAYETVPKPQTLSSTSYFRSVQMFKILDKKNPQTGVVAISDVKQNCSASLRRDFVKSMPILIEILSQIPAPTIHILTFLDILASLELRDSEDRDSKRKEIQKASHEIDEANAQKHANANAIADFQALGKFGRFWFDTRRWWHRHIKHKRHLVPLWKQTFRFIEAHFGASNVSYFYFLQSLFWLNLWTGILFLPIVIVGLATFHWLSVASSDWIGLLMGTGLEKSWLFYGDYNARYGSYRMDLAWVFICVIMYAMALMINLNYMSQKYDAHSDESKMPFCELALNGIDYNVQESYSMKLLRGTNRQSVENLLNEQVERLKHQRIQASLERHYAHTTRMVIGIFLSTLFTIGTSGFVAWLILNERTVTGNPQFKQQKYIGYFSALVVPLFVSFFKVISPIVTRNIVAFEQHARSTIRFRHIFIRLFIIRMFYVLVLMFQTIYAPSATNSLLSTVPICPETQVGVVYYKLLMVDLGVEIILSLFIPYLRLTILRKLCFWTKHEYRSGSDFGITLQEDAHQKIQPKDYFKNELDIPKEIIDMIYRQALIWSGTPFCPVLPLLGILTTALFIFTKATQIKYLIRPPIKPMGVARQTRYFRATMVVTLTICIIPFSFFLRRNVECGPHYGSTPVDVFFAWVETLPSTIAFIFAYMRNIVLLWLVFIIILVYGIYLSKRKGLLKSELAMVRLRVKMEVKEKRVIIRENGIMLDHDQERGKFMFREWMQAGDMQKFADRYCCKLQESYFDDLLELVKLDDNELETLMLSWKSDEFSIPPEHIEFFKSKLYLVRRNLL